MYVSFNRSKRLSARSGTIYIMAMGASLVVACLAVAGLQSVRVQRRMNDQIAQTANARKLAEAGIEFVRHRMQIDANWRNFFVNGVPVIRNSTGGSFSVTLIDPLDGNTANQTADPVVVTSTGTYGVSIQKLSARIEPQNQLFAACRSALYATDNIDFDGCTVTSNQWAYCDNTVQIQAEPTVNMNVLSKEFLGNKLKLTQRHVEGGTWPMEKPDLNPASPTYVGKYYHDNAEVIDASDIPTGGAEMIQNGEFETSLANWTGSWCTLTRDTGLRRNGVASCLVSGQGFVSSPIQDITEHMIKGRRYRVSFWIRTTQDQEISAVISLTGSGSALPVIRTGPLINVKNNEWTQVTAELEATWSGRLTRAEFAINSERNSNYHFDAVSIQDAEREVGTRYLEHVVLGSGSNPYGSKTVSPNGIYSIHAPGEKLVIRNCRINGTIVVPSAAQVKLENALSWEPAGRNFPALIANAPIEELTTAASLQENTIGINANPVSAPYQGASDNDASDSYPSLISGAMVSTNDVLLEGISELSGPVVSDNGIEVTSADLKINFRSDMIVNPPPGFFSDPPAMRLIPSSVQSVP
jgi:hypothetical protein